MVEHSRNVVLTQDEEVVEEPRAQQMSQQTVYIQSLSRLPPAAIQFFVYPMLMFHPLVHLTWSSCCTKSARSIRTQSRSL